MNISLKNVVSASQHLSGLNTFPAMLNSLSTGDEDAGIPSTYLAISASEDKRTDAFLQLYFHICCVRLNGLAFPTFIHEYK